MAEARLRILACSALADEVRQATAAWRPQPEHIRFDARLHMDPQLLDAEVDLRAADGRDHPTILAAGACAPGLAPERPRPGMVRLAGCNCVEILIGQAERTRLLRAGAFFLLPEWTGRWAEIIAAAFPGRPDLSLDCLRRLHRRMVYLDTGVRPVPADALAACAEACRLPVEVLAVSLDRLADLLLQARRLACGGGGGR